MQSSLAKPRPQTKSRYSELVILNSPTQMYFNVQQTTRIYLFRNNSQIQNVKISWFQSVCYRYDTITVVRLYRDRCSVSGDNSVECLYSVLTCVYKHTRSDPTNGCRGRVRFHYVPCIGYITAAVCSVCTCDSSSHVLNELIRAPAHVLEASCDTFAAQWDLVLFVKRVEYRSCSVFCVIRRRCEASSITEQVVWDSVLVCVCVRVYEIPTKPCPNSVRDHMSENMMTSSVWPRPSI